MPLTIVQYNELILHQKGDKIAAFDASLVQLAEDMVEAMHAAGGIGLAAQQVGIARQICVVDLRESDEEFTWEIDGARPPLELFMPLTLVNPHVTAVSKTPETIFEEGCLSFPKIRGDVVRPDEVVVKFSDERGVPHVLKCDGLLSRCIQHEVDHLNGVLFIDRMDKKTRAKVDESVRLLAKVNKAAAKKKSP